MIVRVTRPKQSAATEPDPAEPAIPPPVLDDQPMLFCPVCQMKLESRKCKLFCARCGYYMSCADYY
jgi:hypothetical protein